MSRAEMRERILKLERGVNRLTWTTLFLGLTVLYLSYRAVFRG